MEQVIMIKDKLLKKLIRQVNYIIKNNEVGNNKTKKLLKTINKLKEFN